MQEYNTQIESWGPFAEGKNDFFTNETLKIIGEKYGNDFDIKPKRKLIFLSL